MDLLESSHLEVIDCDAAINSNRDVNSEGKYFISSSGPQLFFYLIPVKSNEEFQTTIE